MAVLVASCSGADRPEPAHEAAPATAKVAAAAQTPSVEELVAGALGSGIATQDFHLIMEIERVGEDGQAVSIHEQILRQAALGAGPEQPVEGGLLTFAPTDSLQGRIVDTEGNPVPGAGIGFGLLDFTEAGLADALAAFEADSSVRLEPGDEDDGPVLVIYSSTDLSETATLIAPGDQFLLDLTFVEGLSAGDTLRQTVVFGQALEMPGEGSQTWSPAETFAQRFTSGSTTMLTDSAAERAGGLLVATSEEVAIAGSILSPSRIKVLKYTPKAVGRSAKTVWSCSKMRSAIQAAKCGRAIGNAVNRTKSDARKTARNNLEPPPCRQQAGMRCGGATGDVHLRTFGNRAYVLQALGELVAARSSQGHEVQLRMAPWLTSSRVSVNTGVAARIAGATVSVQHQGRGKVEIHVDGEPLSVERGSYARVGNGGALVSTGAAFIGLWPDGARLDIRIRETFLDVIFAVPHDSDATWEGLLGSLDGDRQAPLMLADGTSLASPTAADIHREYADSWRVTDQSSLFHYQAGENTATFTDRSFPLAYVALEDLDQASRAEADRICRDYGISDRDALNACILDVALTDDPGFVVSAGTFQDVAGDGIEPVDPIEPVEVRRGPAALEAPETVPAGSQLEVSWSGPANPGDRITIATPGQAGQAHERRAQIEEGSDTVSMQAPGEAGPYEVRYILAADQTILASRPLDVTAVAATLDAPETAPAGSQLEVSWSGPANAGDRITIATPGQAGLVEKRRAQVEAGSDTVSMQVPGEAGPHEVRYILAADQTILASRPLEVTAVTATLDAPESAPAGSQLEVAWSGPANAGDYITIATPDQAALTNNPRARVDAGTGTVLVRMPDQAGTYELRYYLAAGHTIIATRRIEVLQPR